MRFLIAGLGNIGPDYEQTRHNVGFDVVNRLAEMNDATFTMERLAFHATIRHRGHEVHLIRPTTLMNRSGRSVRYWLKEAKVPIDRLLVVVDELAYDLGKVKMKAAGSHGGHNGLRDIEETLGTRAYTRLRVGIGNDFPRGRQVDYVLGRWTENEAALLPLVVDRSVEACLDFVSLGTDRAMTATNSKPDLE